MDTKYHTKELSQNSWMDPLYLNELLTEEEKSIRKTTKRCKTRSFVYPIPRISKPRVRGSNPLGRANKSSIFVNFTQSQLAWFLLVVF